MLKAKLTLLGLLDKLEEFHGKQQPDWPVEPYDFIVWWHCGYPASDQTCAKGWNNLRRDVGIEPQQLLKASPKRLASALRAGGMVPELRALRLKEIAMRVQDQLGGDLRSVLNGPISEVRKTLKKFPGIADPGADRVLLFAGLAPTAAVPSNCPHVLSRLLRGSEAVNYSKDYRDGQGAIASEVSETFAARTRAYLIVKRHGQEICKRTKPKCIECPVSSHCAYFAVQPPRN
jgi:endonuclease III